MKFIIVHRKTFEEERIGKLRYDKWDGKYEDVYVRVDCIKGFSDYVIEFTDGSNICELKETGREIAELIIRLHP